MLGLFGITASQTVHAKKSDVTWNNPIPSRVWLLNVASSRLRKDLFAFRLEEPAFNSLIREGEDVRVRKNDFSPDKGGIQ